MGEKNNKIEKKEFPVKPGLYKHFKGGKYQVLFTALDSETGNEMVVYRDVHDADKVWVRTKDNFTEQIKKKPRFEFLSEAEDFRDAESLYRRALADYQNLLKRTAQEKEDFAKYANEQFALEIIPVFDNLKISMAHVDEAAQSSGWAEGIKYVIKQFRDALANMGVEEIKTVGEKFDPAIMEAIEGEGEKVLREAKAGYKLKGKVIVAARVVVA